MMSQSEIHAAFKRLLGAGLVRKGLTGDELPYPILNAAEEYLIHAVKYSFPVSLKEYTPGIPTGVAAPVFKNKILMGSDPLPVWPYGKGKVKGLSVTPLYSTIPEAITKYPDQSFYDLLAILDAIRCGRARERNMAVELLREKINHGK